MGGKEVGKGSGGERENKGESEVGKEVGRVVVMGRSDKRLR